MKSLIRLKRHLDSETLHLPELHHLIGSDVEIVVRELPPAPRDADDYPLRGSVLRYDDPFEPVAADDWEAAE